MASPQIIEQDRIFSKLKISLEGQKSQAAFCCGGASKINDKLSRPDIQSKQAPPVILHWASQDGASVQKVVFSKHALRTDDFNSHIQHLTDSCQPASFGKEGKAVMDESYRKATKLDSTCFSTNFHPHDHGILQDIERVLLPAFEKGLKADSTTFVQAELYKLNVYSGPGGKFKAHVDTPRGGALTVRHNGREMWFDWSGQDPKAIEWAAFFSDCEHEVEEVMGGHRVTLTYKMYTTSTSILRHLSSTEVESFPLYHEMKAALSSKGFLAKGGKVGFFCNHFYAQNNGKAQKILPQGLKGIDTIIYVVCRALGLSTGVRPIMEESFRTCDFVESEEDQSSDNNLSPPLSQCHIESGGPRAGTGISTPQPQLQEIPSLKQKIRYTGDRDEDFADVAHPTFDRAKRLVGRRFKKFGKYNGVVGEYDSGQFMRDLWPHDVESIYWVTDNRQKEVALAFATYGNEPSMSCEYSAAAILVDVPAWSEEHGKLQWLKRI